MSCRCARRFCRRLEEELSGEALRRFSDEACRAGCAAKKESDCDGEALVNYKQICRRLGCYLFEVNDPIGGMLRGGVGTGRWRMSELILCINFERDSFT